MFGKKKATEVEQVENKADKLHIPTKFDMEKIQKDRSFKELRELRENLIKHVVTSGTDSVNVTFFYATPHQVLDAMKIISEEFKQSGWSLIWTITSRSKQDKRELFCEHVKFCCERDVVILEIRID